MIRSAIARFATKIPTCCAVCHRHAWWLGYSPKNWGKGPWIWWCEDCAKKQDSRSIYKMPAATLDAVEKQATEAAGDEAGAFLDEISKTDLATLTQDEWREFLRRVVVGFEINMRKLILSGEK